MGFLRSVHKFLVQSWAPLNLRNYRTSRYAHMSIYVLLTAVGITVVESIAIITPAHLYAQERVIPVSLQSTVQYAYAPEDNRIRVLKGFLTSYNSPLTESSATFIKSADTYNLDWRLLPAISGVESTFGKQIPYNSYNAWGWGIYGDNMIRFSSWDEAIETISEGLREKYINKWGAQDVYQIGKFYAASPTWAQRVSYFMQKISDYELNNPDVALSITL